MIKAGTKRILSSNVKRYIVQNLRGNLLANLPVINEKITDGFEIIVDALGDFNTSLDLPYVKEVFSKHLEEFNFLPDIDVQGKLDLIIPNIDTFDFFEIEILEVILNGVVGEYAEANAAEVAIMFSEVPAHLLLISPPEVDNVTYLVPVTDDLLLHEEKSLGYTLNRFPFSNNPPMHEEFFEPVNTYIKTNMSVWISESIKKSIVTVKNRYGGK